MLCNVAIGICSAWDILAVIGHKWGEPMLFSVTTRYCNESLDMLLSDFDWIWICKATLNQRIESVNASQTTARILNRFLRTLFPTKWIVSWTLENFGNKWVNKKLNPVWVKLIMVNRESEKVRIRTCLHIAHWHSDIRNYLRAMLVYPILELIRKITDWSDHCNYYTLLNLWLTFYKEPKSRCCKHANIFK